MRHLFIGILLVSGGFLFAQPVPKISNTTYQTLPFSQDWSNTGLISAADDWSGVPGIVGYRGDALTDATGTDPQTILAPSDVVDVNANQSNPGTFTTGGVSEFEIANPVVAMQGSGTADAPNIVIYLNTTGYENISLFYLLRDVDENADDATQQVALQYRIGSSGDFTNIPGGYVADASIPNAANETPVSLILPSACNDQAAVEIRIITTNAPGSDEWIGVDDILVEGDEIGGAKPVVTLSADKTSFEETTADSVVLTISTNIPVTATETLDIELTGIGEGQYTISETSLTFESGQSEKTVVIKATPDDKIEGETFFTVALVNLSEGLKAGTPTSINLTLVDDDAITVNLSATATEIDETGSFYVVATASQPVGTEVTITLSFSGTATKDKDYSASGTTFTILTGSVTDSLLIIATNDDEFEPVETIIASIDEVAGGAFPGSATEISVNLTSEDVQQAEPIVSARQKAIGAEVIVRGVVTGSFRGNAGSTIYFQDGTGGIALYDKKTDTYVPGDSAQVRGILKDFNGLLEISPVNDTLLLAKKVPAPAPIVLNVNQMAEQYESRLVVFRNVTITADTTHFRSKDFNYTITDQSGSGQMRIAGLDNTLKLSAIPTTSVDMVGIVGEFNGTYQLTPRGTNDIVGKDGKLNVTYEVSPLGTSEQDQTVVTITVRTAVPVDVNESVNVSVGGTGITATDYQLSSSTITIPAGKSSGSVTMTIMDDDETEGTEIISLTFSNPSAGLLIANPNGPSLTISDNDEGAKDYISIAEAKNLPFGTVVTVVGRVTVANEFGGPLYFQDKTRGMACFETNLHTAAAIGDSVKITGPLSEFGAKTGVPGSGLFQISGTGTTFEVFKQNPRQVVPRVITFVQVDESLEGELVRVDNVTINHTGAFQGNKNYTMADATGEMQLRIDNNTNLVNADAPVGTVNIVGVVSQFSGDFQILPRYVEDLGVKPFVIPGEEIGRDKTMEVVTWNLKWFGNQALSGYDPALQIQNVARVLRTINADIYALQEIADDGAWAALHDSLKANGYGAFRASSTQQQKLAFAYKKETVDSLSTRFPFTNGDWSSGRFPYEFSANVTITGITKQIYFINLHAKANTSEPPTDDWNRRVADYTQLKDWLDTNRPSSNVIILGDFNDEVNGSVVAGKESSFKVIADDVTNYQVITKLLSDRRQGSTSRGGMIDHIIMTNELYPVHFDSTQRVENVFYVGNYLSTTSDHFPVWTRFIFDKSVDVADVNQEVPSGLTLAGNYPNPFNPSTSIRFFQPKSGVTELVVYNILGELVSRREFNASEGWQTVSYNAFNLPTGAYFYQIRSGNAAVTGKMMLVK